MHGRNESDSRSGARRRVLVSAGTSAVGYGAWAYFANHAHGASVARQVCLVQAAWSFALTLVLATLMERAASYCLTTRRDPRLAALPALFLVWSGPFAVHTLSGTPEVLRTIAPGAIIGTSFVLAYVANLARKRVAAQVAQ